MSLAARPVAGSGFRTLLAKELLRFWRVSAQTLGAPVLTALLYLLIFAHVLGDQVRVYADVPYAAFLAPGLVMMSILQNAFANGASSLIQSKVTGNLVFVLLPPISHLEFLGAYLIASIARGLAVGAGVLLVAMWFGRPPLAAPVWIVAFAVLGAAFMGAAGMFAGLWAEKFDSIAAYQNFFILPATFLSGVFYSIHSLPDFWQKASLVNPFFYMIDGFRHGFFGQSDVSPWASLGVAVVATACAAGATYALIAVGHKTRH